MWGEGGYGVVVKGVYGGEKGVVGGGGKGGLWVCVKGVYGW